MKMEDSMLGTPPSKLASWDAPETSKSAAESINTNRLERLVYDAINSCGVAGCISDEVRTILAYSTLAYSSVTARYKSLREKGLIINCGCRRPGRSGRDQNVMVAAAMWNSEFDCLVVNQHVQELEELRKNDVELLGQIFTPTGSPHTKQ
jgi:hypothetical protein